MQRKTTVLFAVIIAFTALLIISNVPELYSADLNTSAKCSNETMNSSYGIYRTGTTPDGPLASVGLVSFDTNGKMTARQHTSRNGHFTASKATGRIEVAADCTLKIFDEGGTQISSGVVVDDGNEFFVLNRNSGNTTVLVGKRIHGK